MGVPTVTTEPERITTLIKVLEDNPNTRLHLNLETMVLCYHDTEIPVYLPQEKRDSFVQGTWDSLGV